MASKEYGYTTWWGFSPVLNILEVLSRHEFEYDDKKELNILLIGSGDGRHILKTISKLRKLSNQQVNFYVVENDLEIIARHMLLVKLALQPIEEHGIQDISELFIELYGNTLLRDTTDQYLRTSANELIHWITDDAILNLKKLKLNFSNLKYKERDQLEGIFKFWRDSESKFDISDCWDQRLRHYLGVRYDTRENAYDWEYSMKLKEKASIVNWHEYKQWRDSGVAFQMRDEAAYNLPNKTLASGIIFHKDGERIPKRGYWGDIMNSPYLSYGIESENKLLFKVNNNVHMKTATDVTNFNITSLIHELNYSCAYTEESETLTITEEEELLTEPIAEAISYENVTIHFLSLGCVPELHKKSKFKNKFDLISFSNSMVHFLDASVTQLFVPNGLLMIESTKFMLGLKEELHAEYGKKITNMAKNAGCIEIKQFCPSEHSFAIFKHEG